MQTAIQILQTKKVNQEVLKREFKCYHPPRLDMAINEYPAHLEGYKVAWRIADQLDRIDYHYRQYMKGNCKTLRNVMREIRDLPRTHFINALFIIDTAYCIAVVNEFYELVTKHQAAKRKIIKWALKEYLPPR